LADFHFEEFLANNLRLEFENEISFNDHIDLVTTHMHVVCCHTLANLNSMKLYFRHMLSNYEDEFSLFILGLNVKFMACHKNIAGMGVYTLMNAVTVF